MGRFSIQMITLFARLSSFCRRVPQLNRGASSGPPIERCTGPRCPVRMGW